MLISCLKSLVRITAYLLKPNGSMQPERVVKRRTLGGLEKEGSCRQANFSNGECCGEVEDDPDGWVRTSPVESYPANGFGLMGMHGNAEELTCSTYTANYYGAEQRCGSIRDMRPRVTRGGSWGSPSYTGRSADRDWFGITEGLASRHIGFCVARTP